MANCKLCVAKIKWIKTIGGKSMPCDPEKVYYRYKLGAAERIVTPNGEVLPCVIMNPHIDNIQQADGFGYVPHFATCKGGIHK